MKNFNKKDTKNTEILVITDRSGSMGTIANDVIGGYNRFLEEQKEVEGDAKVTFVQFDDHYEVVYEGKPLSAAPNLDNKTFVPRGMTALYDALGKTLSTQKQRIEKEAWADLVIVCVITDGQENASHEYTNATVKPLIKDAEDRGWKFIYLGANQDSFAVTQNLGMTNTLSAAQANYTADAKGVGMAYASFSDATRALRSSGVSMQVFQKVTDDSSKETT